MGNDIVRASILTVAIFFLSGGVPAAQSNNGEGEIERQLELAAENRPQIQAALDRASPDERPAIEFLVRHMPERDLKSLSSEFLLDNVRLALKVRNKAPWQAEIAEDLFFNCVLPYANLDEPRDAWRADFHARFWPLVENCKSASEAAQILNDKVFREINVKYSTQRRRASQSPKESIEQSIASCSGLSIILVDACRSVGVPARVVGIPKWANKDGNHTWVEIWDGQWHFTGAAEFDPAGLDRAWFIADAALAEKSSLYSSIYAVSYQPTGEFFPLAWARDNRTIHAENVTDHYTRNQPKPSETQQVRTMIRIKDAASGKRVAADIAVWPSDKPDEKKIGKSADESRDLNDILSFDLVPDSNYVVQILDRSQPQAFAIRTSDQPQQILDFAYHGTEIASAKDANPSHETPEKNRLKELAIAYFNQPNEPETAAPPDPQLQSLLDSNPSQCRQVLWEAWLASVTAQSARGDFEKNQVIFGQHLSPYTIKTVGQLPLGETKWPLFIAMHGGGNAPKEVNDSQWKVMERYYKEQSDLGGYRYLALRAPNDSWNGFYDTYVYPLVENLISQQITFNDVDPNRVYLIGYSHGGYGAFAIGPKIPYRFAAIHASAAAPTDGETTAKTLRTTRFTYMVGENDNAYGRRERCEAFAKQTNELRGDRSDIYPVEMFLKTSYGHTGLPDRDMVRCLLPFTRNPVPREISWELTDDVVKDFYWLSVDSPGKGRSVEARVQPVRGDVAELELETKEIQRLTVWLDERVIGDAKQVAIKLNGKTTRYEIAPRVETLCQSLRVRRDPDLAFSTRIELEIDP